MNLIVDIGNTAVKCAVMEGHEFLSIFIFRADNPAKKFLKGIIREYNTVDKAIVVSTRGDAEPTARWLRDRVGHCLVLGPDTPTPIKNLYGTPGTLGYDRLAGAVGAAARFPGRAVMVVDFGTAITVDEVSAAGEFLGGNISPGASMRFRALHEQTRALPLVAMPGEKAAAEAVETHQIGTTTEEAIMAGVINGITYEIEGYVARMKQRNEGAEIIFTGGDAEYFAKRLKFPIFVSYNLVFEGLDAILEYNSAR